MRYSNHFIQSFSGLATIRAFGWEQSEIEVNHELTDASQKPFYLFHMIQRWLTLVLDLSTAALTLVLVGLATKLRGSLSPSFVGVALVNVTGLSNTIKGCILIWTDLESSLGAVARVRDFENECASEIQPQEKKQPPAGWPLYGQIEYENVSAAYM
jgi:ATP-binding cassette subfamily C (CFTR/MRP) protein 1